MLAATLRAVTKRMSIPWALLAFVAVVVIIAVKFSAGGNESAALGQLQAQAAERQEADFQRAAAAQKILIGMPAALVAKAWGEPQKKIEQASAGGASEQWVYPGFNYVYLRDGKVTSWTVAK